MRDRLVLLAIITVIWSMIELVRFVIPVQSLFIVTFLLVLYTIFTTAAFSHQDRRLRKKPQRLNLDYEPTVCIMIPAHNEETVIEKTIENIAAIDYEKFEIFVIDDRSDDDTAKVIKEVEKNYGGKVKAIIRDKDAFPGKSAVLNDALALTNADVICVFDADARVKKDFLKVLLPYLAPEEVGAVQARKIIINKELNILTACQNNEYTLDNHLQLSRDSINGAVELRGNGQLIKRAALLEVDGWNNNTITDDLDLSTKLHLNGWGIRYCPIGEVYEEAILKPIPLLKQRRRWVEGSIRRYLDYCVDVATSEVISLRASFDMLAYMLEFVIPVLLVGSIIVQSLKYMKGYENHLLSTAAVGVGICLFFFLGIVYSLRKYDKQPVFKAIGQAIITGIYMVVLWIPLVTWIVFKILIFKRDMNWGKTSHGLENESIKPVKQVEAAVEVATNEVI
ncbi:MAG: glycosyltransferase family 2 protein [Candidatus Gastranaerophilales bacterium]|nr:glycosyltransferase family 2 protein [Candidatus Gastranaerophilales bacterium]